MHNEEYLVTVNVPPSLEEAMVDCLLTYEAEHGFTSFAVSAHYHDHQSKKLLNIEQVVGRQRAIRFQMYLNRAEIKPFIDRLKSEFAGAGVRYWVLPIIEKGII